MIEDIRNWPIPCDKPTEWLEAVEEMNAMLLKRAWEVTAWIDAPRTEYLLRAKDFSHLVVGLPEAWMMEIAEDHGLDEDWLVEPPIARLRPVDQNGIATRQYEGPGKGLHLIYLIRPDT